MVKLAIFLRLSGMETPNNTEILRVLTGEYFESFGISNLIEEDFFAWILEEAVVDEALKMSQDQVKSLRRYDLSKAEEDLFKEMYEQMVELGQRHRLGEYYTPEWLSKKTLLLALEVWKEKNEDFPRTLDPACGSGTFLTNAIHLLKTDYRPQHITDEELLTNILNKVVGVDVNPLAVVIARANYIIALGDLLKIGKSINIPVFVSDSIKLPKSNITIVEGIKVYDVEADGFHLQIPVSVTIDNDKRGKIILALRESVKDYKLRRNSEQSYQILRRTISDITNENERSVLKQTLKNLEKLVDKEMDSIWIFILNNIYSTLSLKGRKFELLASNPPWLVMRSIENRKYQDFLKEQVFNYELLESRDIKLFPHMEMATLFYCRTCDLYLEKGGIIAFLMPISVITGAYQHTKFQHFKKPLIKLLSVHNFRNVKSVFSLPLCVLLSRNGYKTKYPVVAFDYVGKLAQSQKNERLENVQDQIRTTKYRYRPPVIPKHPSYYHKKFKEGATIVPRNLWFIEFELMPTLGAFNTSNPKVKTSPEVIRVAKRKWKDQKISGNVESVYVFATLLGKDLFPFGFVKFRPVLLPIEQSGESGKYRILDSEQLRLRGATKMADWVDKAQEIWEAGRTQKSQNNFPRVIDRLDYQSLLKIQNQRRYIVLFNARGADSLAYVLDREKLPNWTVQKSSVSPVNFVVDYTAYYFETKSSQEAHYLCAVLNSNVVHQAVKGFQPSGLYGKRDIGRRPLKLAIPQFNGKINDHQTLVLLSKKCHKIVGRLCNTDEGFRKTRNQAIATLKNELKQIDKIVSNLIKI